MSEITYSHLAWELACRSSIRLRLSDEGPLLTAVYETRGGQQITGYGNTTNTATQNLAVALDVWSAAKGDIGAPVNA